MPCLSNIGRFLLNQSEPNALRDRFYAGSNIESSAGFPNIFINRSRRNAQ